MRLQKYMAECGVASRRKCEEIIAAGRVTVNGAVVDVMGAQVEEGDAVCVDGAPIRAERRKQYILLNKPQGVVTTLSDPQGRKTVRDLIEGIPERIYPVGRLDYDTEGLLLLTNEGGLAHDLLSPRHHVDKVYYARVAGRLTEEDCRAFAQGITLEDGLACMPAGLEILSAGQESEAHVTLREGKFHQVKRMLASRGKPVTYLERVRMGNLTLDESLPRGKYRFLTPEEVECLRKF